MEVTRRGFLGTAFGVGSDIAFNKGKVTKLILEKLVDSVDSAVGKSEAAGVLGNSNPTPSNTQSLEVVLTEEEKQVLIKMNRGLSKFNENNYSDSYDIFVDAYKGADKRSYETKNLNFKYLKLVALMHAALPLVNAPPQIKFKGFSPVAGKKDYLVKAAEFYQEALSIRKELYPNGNHNITLKAGNLGNWKVADEKLIRERVVKVYEDLADLTDPRKDPRKDAKQRQLREREYNTYLRSLYEIYARLVKLEKEPNKNASYQSRLAEIAGLIKVK